MSIYARIRLHMPSATASLPIYLVQLRMYTVYVSLEIWIRNTHMPLGVLEVSNFVACTAHSSNPKEHPAYRCSYAFQMLSHQFHTFAGLCVQALSNRTLPKKIKQQFTSIHIDSPLQKVMLIDRGSEFEPPGQASNKPCAAAASNGARDGSTCAASHIGGTGLVVCEDIL